MDDAHRALRDEIFRRLEATRDDRNVTNTDGSNFWGPRITKAVKDRDDDGPALIEAKSESGARRLFEALRRAAVPQSLETPAKPYIH